MKILADIWGEWAPPKTLINATKRVGISVDGFDVDWVQIEKFESARLLTEDVETTANSSIVASPIGVRKYSAEYYKLKFE